jgi:DNA-binding transcriptional regulator YdaS (Cro superfamily)
MELASWMQETGTTPEALAAKVGVHLVTVYHWRAKRKFPRIEHLHAIETATAGAVTASDFVPRREAAA